jgi:hypothetical protein
MSHAPPSARPGSPRRARRGLTAALAFALLAPVGLAAPAAADVPTTEAAPAAAGWIARTLATGGAPTAERQADAVLAFAASGTADDLAADTFAALTDRAAEFVGDDDSASGDAAKLLLAAASRDADPTDLGGYDAESALRERMDTAGDTAGRFRSIGETQLFVQSLAILALSTTDAGVPAVAVDYLAERACDDGSFTVSGSCPRGGDVDTTAVAAQALLAADRPVDDAVAFLLSEQTAGGGLPASDVNANSSALAAQTLRAAGEVTAADAAATFVASLQKGCDAPVGARGAVATYPDADGDLWIATTQSVFATSPTLDQLDASGAASGTPGLACPDAFCPADSGISVVVDFTELVPDADPQVACVTDVPEGASGLDLLALAGFDPRTQDFGGDLGEALCTIDGLPILADDQCFGDGFWSYWNAERGGDWTEYQIGAGTSTPTEGSIEGFAWASGAAAPPRVSPPAVVPSPPFDRGIAAACPGSYPNPFTDITGSVHEGAIRCLAAADITQGTSDPTIFGRARDVTRAQVASFLARAYEEATGDALPAGPDRFPDDDGSVHEANIDALAAAGVILGVGDGSEFAPGDSLTRAQMASLIDRFLDLLDDDELNRSFPGATTTDVFADDAGSVHEPAINRLAVTGVVSGLRSGGYGPQDEVTREQVASFLARGLDLAVSEGHASPIG